MKYKRKHTDIDAVQLIEDFTAGGELIARKGDWFVTEKNCPSPSQYFCSNELFQRDFEPVLSAPKSNPLWNPPDSIPLGTSPWVTPVVTCKS